MSRNGSGRNSASPTTRKRSSKGALIKGMSGRLPSEILENTLFPMRLREIMHKYAGIYALYRGDRLYYTGLTRNLFGRIKWHLKDRHAHRWDHFTIFRIQKVPYIKDIETLVHHLVDTSGNRSKGKVPKDADINWILRDVVREHERALRGLKKALR